MPKLEELVNATPMAAYIEELQSNKIPYFGSTLFPAKKKRGLSLEWLKGYNSLPVSLMPSAFDAKATVRDRIGVSTVMTKMPFFRESMRLGEEERQEIMDLLDRKADNPYLVDAINRIYDDRKQLVEGADVVPERMIMSLLINGQISIAGPDAKGRNVAYAYNYDPDGKWAAKNTETLTGTHKWSDSAHATPTADILKWKRAMSRNHGVDVSRAVCNSTVWGYLLQSEEIRKAINPVGYQNMGPLTDLQLKQYLLAACGITLYVYDKMYKDADGTEKNFYADDYITFFPAGVLGNTWYGTTPEEADLMSGESQASVAIVNTGVAITTFKEPHPVNVVTVVSEIVLPSFENMSSVFTAKVN
jgi:hypothetical protein